MYFCCPPKAGKFNIKLQTMKFTYYGHSCFAVEIRGKKVLFDPFITYNELAKGKVSAEEVEADYILVSHAHQDHIADLVPIAKRTGAKVVASYEITEWLGKQGIENVHPMNTGGKWSFNEFSLKCVVAHHSSSFPDGSYGGNPLGFIIYSEEGNFYYSGDTALTLDMQLIAGWVKLNFAVLPIGDNFTMDAADALKCSEMIGCREIIGVHYDTFGYIKINHEQVKQEFQDGGANLRLLNIGETVTL
jgi:L-ascorbate metabolism protein UlaG (beta-lactamase superfamily)